MATKPGEHKSTPFAITDFETGGLDLSKYAITEIAILGIKGDTLEETARYESLIKPYSDKYAYDQEAFEKTGLSITKLEKEGKPIDIVINEVIETLDKINVYGSSRAHKVVMIAHNATFEVQCYQHLFNVTGKLKEFEKIFQGNKDYYGNFHPAYMDTQQLAKFLYAANVRQKYYNLEAVCERAGIGMADGHRAMNDVIPSTELVRYIIKLMRAAESGQVKEDSVGAVSFRSGFKYEF